MAVVLNIEPDHLDIYGSAEEVQDAFAQFMASAPINGHVIACTDSPRVRGTEQGVRLRPGALVEGHPAFFICSRIAHTLLKTLGPSADNTEEPSRLHFQAKRTRNMLVAP